MIALHRSEGDVAPECSGYNCCARSQPQGVRVCWRLGKWQEPSARIKHLCHTAPVHLALTLPLCGCDNWPASGQKGPQILDGLPSADVVCRVLQKYHLPKLPQKVAHSFSQARAPRRLWIEITHPRLPNRASLPVLGVHDVWGRLPSRNRAKRASRSRATVSIRLTFQLGLDGTYCRLR